MKENISRRILSTFMALCLAIGSFSPCFAYAAEANLEVNSVQNPNSVVAEGEPELVESTSQIVPSETVSDSDGNSSSESLSDSVQSESSSESNSDTNESDSSASSEPGHTGSLNQEVSGETTDVPDSTTETESNSDSATPESSSSDSYESENSSESKSPESNSEKTDSESSNSESETTDADSKNNDSVDKPAVNENKDAAPEENTIEFVPFNILISGETDITAGIGSTQVLKIDSTRTDVNTTYQWQKKQTPIEAVETKPLFEYGTAPTFYDFPLYGVSEHEILTETPGFAWPGIETYIAIVDALDAAGIDSTNVKIAYRTTNFALYGYTITANQDNGVVSLYAEKGNEKFQAYLNADSEWAFDNEPSQLSFDWKDIADATAPEYEFIVSEDDFRSNYRCVVTIDDKDYIAECIDIAKSNDDIIPENAIEEKPVLYSPSFKISPIKNMAQIRMAAPAFFSMRAASEPYLSADKQWIDGLNQGYQYITKDTHDMILQWEKEGYHLSEKQKNRYWTSIGPKGFNDSVKANILDSKTKKPIGDEANFRYYQGFDLIDGNKLPINSEWYGKTVYFRPVSPSNTFEVTGTAIDIPGYTELGYDVNGDRTGASGQYYKNAITVLNPFVEKDSTSKYEQFVSFCTAENENVDSHWLKQFVKNGKTDSFFKDADVSHDKRYNVNVLPINCEYFNEDPKRYMVDAEGNYRVDSVAWGVCVAAEPDLSGKAYWEMKNFLSQGYGFLIGHDTLYAYSGSYYDTYNQEFNESSIDPNDGETWYYDVNSWNYSNGHYQTSATKYERTKRYNPQTHQYEIRYTPSGKDTDIGVHRGGHYYLNQLIGSNNGNIFVNGNQALNESPSHIVSLGGSNAPYFSDYNGYGKKENIMFCGDLIQIQMPAENDALLNYNSASIYPKYRVPTNYPYDFVSNDSIHVQWVNGKRGLFEAPLTHTNNQMSFANIWANYDSNNLEGYAPAWNWSLKDKFGNDVYGTNNFYLSGDGNFLMNQIGHLNNNTATPRESMLLVNSLFFISQRKQCEICAANQNGHEVCHFVRRVNEANKDDVLKALQGGGNYWYPIDGCYQLIEDLQLPDDWKSIKNFRGHWNNDVYSIYLGKNNAPFFENTSNQTLGENGWNLGTEANKGTQNVFNANGNRTTGVARVLGDLNDLFDTNLCYVDYTVKIFGSDNPKYMSAGEVYTCTVNSDSKYVISNLPCVYDENTHTGILKARVYRPDGSEVTEYGPIKTNVQKHFWNDEITTPLYLDTYKVSPVKDMTTHESMPVDFSASVTFSQRVNVDKWQYRTHGGAWTDVPASMGVMRNNGSQAGDDYMTVSYLHLKDPNPVWDGYEFRCVFSHKGNQVSTSEFYKENGRYSLTPISANSRHTIISSKGVSGKLSVKLWPYKVIQDNDKTVFEGKSANFNSKIYVVSGDNNISYNWQSAYEDWSTTLIGQKEWFWDDVNSSMFNYSVGRSVYRVGDNDTVYDELFYGTHYSDAQKREFKQNAGIYCVDTTLRESAISRGADHTRYAVTAFAETKYGTQYNIHTSIANSKNATINNKYVWATHAGYLDEDGRNNNNATPVVNGIHRNSEIKVNIPDVKVFYEQATAHNDSRPHAINGSNHGQFLKVYSTDANAVASGAAKYRAYIYLYADPSDSLANDKVTWDYRNAKVQAVNRLYGNTFGGNANVYFSNLTPVRDAYGNQATAVFDGKVYRKYESTIGINNVRAQMYNRNDGTMYMFRCHANFSYPVTNRIETIDAVDSRSKHQWGELVVDYNIGLQHMGVLGYNNANGNIIDGTRVDTLGDAKNKLTELSKTHQEHATWSYPNLKLNVPDSKKVHSVTIKLEGAHDSRDQILFDGWYFNNKGIDAVYADSKHDAVIFSCRNGAYRSTWEDVLRNYVSFKVYDTIAYGKTNAKNEVRGGVKVSWYVSDKVLSDINIAHPQGFNVFELKTSSTPLTWNEAYNAARAYNSNYGVNGSLAVISSQEENNRVTGLVSGLGNNHAWIAPYRDASGWHSINGYSNWRTGTDYDTILYGGIKNDGSWAALQKNYAVNKSMYFLDEIWTNQDGVSNNAYNYYLSTKNPSATREEFRNNLFELGKHPNSWYPTVIGVLNGTSRWGDDGNSVQTLWYPYKHPLHEGHDKWVWDIGDQVKEWDGNIRGRNCSFVRCNGDIGDVMPDDHICGDGVKVDSVEESYKLHPGYVASFHLKKGHRYFFDGSFGTVGDHHGNTRVIITKAPQPNEILNLQDYKVYDVINSSPGGSINDDYTGNARVFTANQDGEYFVCLLSAAYLPLTEYITGNRCRGHLKSFEVIDLTRGAASVNKAEWDANAYMSDAKVAQANTRLNELGNQWYGNNFRWVTQKAPYVKPIQESVDNRTKYYVVQYKIDPINLSDFTHSASDSDIIGSFRTPDPDKKREIYVNIAGNEKEYDKNPIYPKSFSTHENILLNGSIISTNNTNPNDLKITISSVSTKDGSVFKKVTNGNGLVAGNLPVNSGEYTIKIELSDSAKLNQNIVGFTSDSVLQANLTIKQRKVNIVGGGDKVYDGNEFGVIKNIHISSGVVGGDVVRLNISQSNGVYFNKDGNTKKVSTAFNNGNPWDMKTTGNNNVKIVHNSGSDPHHNYVIGNISFKGKITPRPLYLHSLHHEASEPNVGRNTKVYDNTKSAVVRGVIIDAVPGNAQSGPIKGDSLKTNKNIYKGLFDTQKAGERLDSQGNRLENSMYHLAENGITITEPVSLIGDDAANYKIQMQKYSGGISRRVLEVLTNSWNGIYGQGMAEKPAHYKKPVTNQTFLPIVNPSFVTISNLADGDTLVLDNKSYFEIIGNNRMDTQIVPTTPVGSYPITYQGLNETNYPLLSNYFVNKTDGVLVVGPREIMIEVGTFDKMVNTDNPNIFSTFKLQTTALDSYKDLGSDENTLYKDMKLIGQDTIENTIFVSNKGSLKGLIMDDKVSNIPYQTECKKDSPVFYPTLQSNVEIIPCEFCKKYWGLTDEHAHDCAHWLVGSYRVEINQIADNGNTLEVKKITNPLGESVQNYTIKCVQGGIKVHPELRFQLKATVPMYVCMYADNENGEVVEPTDYGITNYSNGAIQVDDIEVVNGEEGTWRIVAPELLVNAGEMTMKMNDTQLVMGSNSPVSREKWIVGRKQENGDGSFLPIKMDCKIAPDSVNDKGEEYVTMVRYTISEYGVTLPEGYIDPMPEHVGPDEVNPLH